MSRHHPRSTRDVKRDLRAIYTGSDGTMPDLSKLSYTQRSKTTSILIKLILILLGLSVVAWSGFFLFNKGLIHESETLKVQIEGPDQIKSGEPVSYTIRYENKGDVPIASLDMKLNVPTSFHVLSLAPEATGQNEWTIGSLGNGSDGAVTVNGVFLSEVPSSQRLQALFTYKPANFSSDFQKIETKIVQINESVLKLTVTGPEKALAGDNIEYTLNLQNTGQVDVFNVRVFPVLPENFTISTTEPKLAEGNEYWNLDVLKGGELKELTYAGTFTTTASGEQVIGARVGFVKEEQVLEQSNVTTKTDVLGGALSFHLIIDGSNKDQTVVAGKTLRGSIDFANSGAETAEDITFTLNISTESGSVPISFENALVSDAVRTGSTLVWTKEKTTSLAKLLSGGNGIIDFSLPIIESLDQTMADKFMIKLTAEIGRVGSITTPRTIEASPIVIRINSNAHASAEVRYFTSEGESVGTGFLPPKLGQTTHLRIYWKIENSLHALNNIEFSTTLPQDVTFDEKKGMDIGDISYNPTTRQVQWTTAKLPVDIIVAQAWFDVGFTPTQQDVGSFFKLTNPISFLAKDSVTGDELNKSIDQLTTDFENDPLAKGKGVVTE